MRVLKNTELVKLWILLVLEGHKDCSQTSIENFVKEKL
jgi:hypothetical protein